MHAQEVVTVRCFYEPLRIWDQDRVIKIIVDVKNASNLTIFYVGKPGFRGISKSRITRGIIVVCQVPAIAHFQSQHTCQALADVTCAFLVLEAAAFKPGLLHMEGDHALNIRGGDHLERFVNRFQCVCQLEPGQPLWSVKKSGLVSDIG